MNPVTLRASMPAPRTILASLAALAVITACRPPAPPAGSDAGAPAAPTAPRGIAAGSLTASAGPSGIALQNQTEWPLYVRVVVRDSAGSVAACTAGGSCPRLVQGEQRTVSYASIPGASSGTTEFIVVWWQSVRSSNGNEQVGPAQTVTVRR